MSKITQIIEGFFLLSLYKLGLITDDEILSEVSKRQNICANCPINDKGWCSSNRSIYSYVKSEGTNGAFKVNDISVKGCGCFLAAKWFSNIYSNKKDNCPRGLW